MMFPCQKKLKEKAFVTQYVGENQPSITWGLPCAHELHLDCPVIDESLHMAFSDAYKGIDDEIITHYMSEWCRVTCKYLGKEYGDDE